MSTPGRRFMSRQRAGMGRLGFKFMSMRRVRPRFRQVPQRLTRFNGHRGRFVPNTRQGIELKFYDQKLVDSTLGTATDSTGGEHDPSATLMMNTVTQGDGEQQRDGRKITMKSIYVEGLVDCAKQATQSSGDNASSIFIALVMDQQTNGAQIVSENVYTNPGGTALLQTQPFRNLSFTSRYRVLAVRKFTLQDANFTNDTGATGGVIQQGLRARFKIFKKLNREVTYSATTETIANIVDNSLHLLAWCSDTGLAPKLSYQSRLRFVG